MEKNMQDIHITNRFIQGLNYSDVFLVPNKTIVDTRKQCDTSVKFGNRTFSMPIIPANMASVVNEGTCKFLAKQGFFYIMHRFNINVVQFMESMQKENLFTSISIGVNEDTYRDLTYLKDLKWSPDYMTLDVANGWCYKAERMIKFVKDNFPTTFLIVGNMATPDAVAEIEYWGADAIKVGIAGGAVCTTKNKTGFHVPMVNTVLECVQVAKTPVIADGGVLEHGDIAKAIACGATMVMAGKLFAGFDESAGEVTETNGKLVKEYYGSASQYNKGEYKNVEGKKILVDYKGSMQKLLNELKEDLQSSISYAGGKDLSALLKCKFIDIK
jgi:GMP reductase